MNEGGRVEEKKEEEELKKQEYQDKLKGAYDRVKERERERERAGGHLEEECRLMNE